MNDLQQCVQCTWDGVRLVKLCKHHQEIDELHKRLAAAEAAARWWRMAARGYILEEGEVHPDERWPWLVDEAADEAAKGGRE